MADLPQIQLPDNCIHLGLGQPGSDLLPISLMKSASETLMASGQTDFLAYGATRGNPGFRQSLADFLTEQTPVPAKPDQLLVTNGNSQALDLICTLFTRPGDTVLVEAPTYFLALKIFRDHGLNLVPIPMESQGLKTDSLEQILKTCSPKFLYTIPFYHNPTGISLSLERQEALARIAAAKNLMVVSDEVYWFLHFDQAPPPSLARFNKEFPLFSLGSFSKIMAPGLRLGWIQSGSESIKNLTQSGLLQSGGGLNPFTSAVMEVVIRQGMLKAQIDLYNQVYAKRACFLQDCLNQALPPGIKNDLPGGGYFFWLNFPPPVDFMALRKSIQAHDVDIYPGPYFDPVSIPGKPGSAFSSCIRLSFALYPEEDLAKGVDRLSRALHQLLPDLYS